MNTLVHEKKRVNSTRSVGTNCDPQRGLFFVEEKGKAKEESFCLTDKSFTKRVQVKHCSAFKIDFFPPFLEHVIFLFFCADKGQTNHLSC